MLLADGQSLTARTSVDIHGKGSVNTPRGRESAVTVHVKPLHTNASTTYRHPNSACDPSDVAQGDKGAI